MDIIKKQRIISHPLEETFDIEPGTTIVEYVEPQCPATIPDVPSYDIKDNEIEEKFDEIYKTAMKQAVAAADEMEVVEGRHKAKVGEVAASMLNVALGAARERRMMKEHKDKLSTKPRTSSTGASVTNNNLIVADRNEILKALIDGKK